MARTIATRSTTSKGPSKETKQIQKLQEENKELVKQLREAKKEIRELKKSAAAEKRDWKEEKSEFEEKLEDFEEEKQREIEKAIKRVRQSRANEMKCLVEKNKEQHIRWVNSVEEIGRWSKQMTKNYGKAIDDLFRCTKLPAAVGKVVFENLLTEVKEEVKKCADVWQRTEEFFRKFREHALSGNPLCKKCRNECEQHRVNPDGAHPADNFPTYCKICCNDFSEVPGQVPRLLRCGHSLCERCIDRMKIGPTLICPFDRQETIVPLFQAFHLPKNFSVIDIINAMPIEEEEMGEEDDDVIVLD